MIDRGKRSILGVGVDVVDYHGVLARIAEAVESRRPLGVSALAVHGVMTGALDPEHKFRLNRLDLVVPDGQPVRWALRLLHGEPLPDRVYGPELTTRLCALAAERGWSVFFFGSRQPVLDALAANLQRRYPTLGVAGTEPSTFRELTAEEDAALRHRIRRLDPDLVFVGLGCPRQEAFVYEHVAALGRPTIAVGAAFDFHAGLLPQAPNWMQASGLEWLFRLAVEPRRLWRRYVLLNPLYCIMIAVQALGLAKTAMAREVEPREALRHG